MICQFVCSLWDKSIAGVYILLLRLSLFPINFLKLKYFPQVFALFLAKSAQIRGRGKPWLYSTPTCLGILEEYTPLIHSVIKITYGHHSWNQGELPWIRMGSWKMDKSTFANPPPLLTFLYTYDPFLWLKITIVTLFAKSGHYVPTCEKNMLIYPVKNRVIHPVKNRVK